MSHDLRKVIRDRFIVHRSLSSMPNSGAAGFLYPAGDYETAVSLTKQLVLDPALRERIGGAARLEVKDGRHLLLMVVLRPKVAQMLLLTRHDSSNRVLSRTYCQ